MNWRKSSYSGQAGGNCVEVAGHDSRVLVRDTKNRGGALLRFTPQAWRRFAGQVKAGRPLASGPVPAITGGRSRARERPLRHRREPVPLFQKVAAT